MPRCVVTQAAGSRTRLLTAEEVAQQLQVPTGWVYSQARAGRFPNVRAGRYVRFDQRDVDAWIDQQRKATRAESRAAARLSTEVSPGPCEGRQEVTQA
jgi:excisionase family DNA binding protein